MNLLGPVRMIRNVMCIEINWYHRRSTAVCTLHMHWNPFVPSCTSRVQHCVCVATTNSTPPPACFFRITMPPSCSCNRACHPDTYQPIRGWGFRTRPMSRCILCVWRGCILCNAIRGTLIMSRPFAFLRKTLQRELKSGKEQHGQPTCVIYRREYPKFMRRIFFYFLVKFNFGGCK